MKKAILVVAVALVAIAIAAPPASAVSLGADEYLAKIKDVSNLYRDEDEDALVPQPHQNPTIGILPGDEQRTLFQVTTIFDGADIPVFTLADADELTGVLYDLTVLAVTSTSEGLVIDFGPAGAGTMTGRNPLNSEDATLIPSIVDAAGPDGLFGTADDPTYDPDGPGGADPVPIVFGGVLEVYNELGHDYTTDPNGVGDYDDKLPAGPTVLQDAGFGPSVWVEGDDTGGGHAPGASPASFLHEANTADEFVNVTDGSLWLAAVLIDLNYLVSAGVVLDPALGPDGIGGTADDGIAFAAGTVLRETINFAAGDGDGFAYLNAVGGSFAPNILGNLLGNTFIDMSMLFNVNTPIFNAGTGQWQDTVVYKGLGQWQVDSEDPVVFETQEIPEPATMSLLGLGLVGLIAARRRKKS